MEVHELTDGGQTAEQVAAWLAGFLRSARQTLELALYDIRLPGAVGDTIAGELRAASERGVAVRLLYNVDSARPPAIHPPPGTRPELLHELPIDDRAVPGVPDLMHHKYVVRDNEALWTGSVNWTDDSWSVQENVIVTVDSPAIAHAFTLNFEELWEKGDVEHSGFVEPRPADVDGARVRPWFTPGFADALTHRIAKKVGRAERVRICSPVITSAPVLATLAQRIADGSGDIAGCVDATQIEDVIRQWTANGNVSWKIPLLQQVLAGEFTGKRSVPWQPTGTLHNFMHAKLVVADDVVFTGSFNLSHSGEKNAENVLEIEDAGLAAALSAYVDEVRQLYPALRSHADLRS
jgi:phosphatidylserine/phosphatidylglycerophosphate/cardiolipin synthase-like enzyme